jgi:transcription antitermination factor NusG
MKTALNEVRHSNEESGLAWYALYTKHQHEKKAADLLARKEFDVLLPLYSAMHKWKDRKVEVLLPVFPGYLFVRTTLSRKLDLLCTSGVFWMVSSAGQACIVPERDIQMVRRISSAPQRIQPHAYLSAGELVRVRVGPFAGLRGVLTRVKSSFRVVLSLELLQKSVALELDASQIELCAPSCESSLPARGEARRIA